MARQSTSRTTIKNDPFATVIPMNGDAEAYTEAEAVEEVTAVQVPSPVRPENSQPFRRQKLTAGGTICDGGTRSHCGSYPKGKAVIPTRPLTMALVSSGILTMP